MCLVQATEKETVVCPRRSCRRCSAAGDDLRPNQRALAVHGGATAHGRERKSATLLPVADISGAAHGRGRSLARCLRRRLTAANGDPVLFLKGRKISGPAGCYSIGARGEEKIAQAENRERGSIPDKRRYSIPQGICCFCFYEEPFPITGDPKPV